jgi:phage gpG-like protein
VIDGDLSLSMEEVERSIAALAAALEDPSTPLLRVGGVIRSRARKAFAAGGPGWKPLAPSTQKRKITAAEVELLVNRGRGKTAERSIVQRVVRDADAIGKWAAREETIKAQIESARSRGKKTGTLEKRRDAAVEQQKKRLDNFKAYDAAGDKAGISGDALVMYARREVARAKARGALLRQYRAIRKQERAESAYRGVDVRAMSVESRRAISRLGARRYQAREESTRILGGLENTISMKLVDGGVRVFSKAYIGGIHNEGGTAGNGAQIPARPFLDLLDSDKIALARFLEEQALAEWNDGGE